MAIYKDYGQNKTTDVKTAEELLKEKRITPETEHHNYAYLYRAVCEVIEQAQKEAYNQALEDEAKAASQADFEKRVMGCLDL